jgi:hypothetical protein
MFGHEWIGATERGRCNKAAAATLMVSQTVVQTPPLWLTATGKTRFCHFQGV